MTWIEQLAYSVEVFDRPHGNLVEVLARLSDLDLRRAAAAGGTHDGSGLLGADRRDGDVDRHAIPHGIRPSLIFGKLAVESPVPSVALWLVFHYRAFA